MACSWRKGLCVGDVRAAGTPAWAVFSAVLQVGPGLVNLSSSPQVFHSGIVSAEEPAPDASEEECVQAWLRYARWITLLQLDDSLCKSGSRNMLQERAREQVALVVQRMEAEQRQRVQRLATQEIAAWVSQAETPEGLNWVELMSNPLHQERFKLYGTRIMKNQHATQEQAQLSLQKLVISGVAPYCMRGDGPRLTSAEADKMWRRFPRLRRAIREDCATVVDLKQARCTHRSLEEQNALHRTIARFYYVMFGLNMVKSGQMPDDEDLVRVTGEEYDQLAHLVWNYTALVTTNLPMPPPPLADLTHYESDQWEEFMKQNGYNPRSARVADFVLQTYFGKP